MKSSWNEPFYFFLFNVNMLKWPHHNWNWLRFYGVKLVTKDHLIVVAVPWWRWCQWFVWELVFLSMFLLHPGAKSMMNSSISSLLRPSLYLKRFCHQLPPVGARLVELTNHILEKLLGTFLADGDFHRHFLYLLYHLGGKVVVRKE